MVCNTGYWDDHGNIKGAMDSKLPKHDRMLACLIEDLHQRGMLQDTLVIAAGEFGRTPNINKDGGRDHWAQASCVLLAGGGFRHGQHLAFDRDRNGTVTQEEFVQVFEDRTKARREFETLDTNRDGVLSRDEFGSLRLFLVRW